MKNETTKKKSKPAFYVFSKDQEGNNKIIGSMFIHKKGKGLNIIIKGERFVAFPPKANFEQLEA